MEGEGTHIEVGGTTGHAQWAEAVFSTGTAVVAGAVGVVW